MAANNKKTIIHMRRTHKEIEKAKKSDRYKFILSSKDESGGTFSKGYLMWTPPGGIYTGQTHILKFKFSYSRGEKLYPTNPPLVKFMTPIWHTNISITGAICLDVLKDSYIDGKGNKVGWSASYGIDSIVSSLEVLFDVPGTDSPFNSNAGSGYMNLYQKGGESGQEEYIQICRNYYEKNKDQANKYFDLFKN